MKKAPGRDYVKVICAVCRGEFYQKDTILITDKNNFQFGQLVCKEDMDLINEQVLPNTKHEQPISSPELLRPDLVPVYTANINDDRLPGPSRFGRAMANPITGLIDLYWQSPEDPGSSNIIGYRVQRAEPQRSFYFDISSNTRTNATYYQDLTGDPSVAYSYQVAAINGFGQGPFSLEFYWPISIDDLEGWFYILSEDGDAIGAEDGDFIFYDE